MDFFKNINQYDAELRTLLTDSFPCIEGASKHHDATSAVRLQGLAEPNPVVIGEATARTATPEAKERGLPFSPFVTLADGMCLMEREDRKPFSSSTPVPKEERP